MKRYKGPYSCVEEILERRARGETYAQITAALGVSNNSITLVIKGRYSNCAKCGNYCGLNVTHCQECREYRCRGCGEPCAKGSMRCRPCAAKARGKAKCERCNKPRGPWRVHCPACEAEIRWAKQQRYAENAARRDDPERLAQDAKRAKELRDRNVSISAIAAEMGLPPHHVSSLLADRYSQCVDCGRLCAPESKRCIACHRRPSGIDVQDWIRACRAADVEYRDALKPANVGAAYTKRKPPQAATDGGRLTDKQKSIIRLLQATPSPIPARAVGHALQQLPRRWIAWDQGGIYMSLITLERRGLVRRLHLPTLAGGGPKWLWLVPADSRQDKQILTLSDARKEVELVQLIEAQEREINRGAWADVDFKTVSLDAQFGEDGGSFHDLLVAGDEPFRAGVVDR